MRRSEDDIPTGMVQEVPVVEGYFTLPPDEPLLLASRCSSCKHWFFPPTFTCHNPSCPGEEVEPAALSPQGRLASYTVIRYPPPPPFVPADPFVPIAIGEVAFPEGLQIAGPMTGADPETLHIGMTVEVVVEPYYENPDGTFAVGWKFRPVDQEGSRA